jgi:hypothetical protein
MFAVELNMDKWLPVTNVIRQVQVRKLTLYIKDDRDYSSGSAG